jgi:hypothetical protein
VRGRLASAALLAIVFSAHDAAAVDEFEIQVYDGTANPPGVPGLELHVNRVLDGLKTAPPPELPLHHRTHFTLEPAFGVTRSLELGAYFQTALRADGTFDYAGTKLRVKLVTPPGWDEHVRLGINVELALLPRRYDASRWGGEVRPIFAWEDDNVLFAINPNIEVALGAPDVSSGPELGPAMMAKLKIAGRVAVGAEYYASLGAIADPAPLREQVHYVFEVVDLISVPQLELNAGIGEGLTSASNALVAKMILGYSWQ